MENELVQSMAILCFGKRVFFPCLHVLRSCLPVYIVTVRSRVLFPSWCRLLSDVHNCMGFCIRDNQQSLDHHWWCELCHCPEVND